MDEDEGVEHEGGASRVEPAAPPHCYIHQDRLAGSVCRRCGRPICPECMREAPVGWQCSRCVHEAARTSPSVRWRPTAAGRLGSTRITPVVAFLIAVNVAVYVWEGTDRVSIQNRFSMWPNGVHVLHQWYRLITGAFLHANAEHILFNMVTLAIVGPPVEAELGKARFGALYLLSALGGSVASYLFSPPNLGGIGASGAIFGLMGAYLVLAWLRRWEARSIGVLIALNLVLGWTSPDIDWRDHIGGLVLGAVVCFGLLARPGLRRGLSMPARSEVGEAVQAVAVVIAASVLLGLLVQLPPGRMIL
jgi:membrane associated rhomboid family serine protease